MQRRSEETKDKLLLLIIMHLNAPYSKSHNFVQKFYFDEEKKTSKPPSCILYLHKKATGNKDNSTLKSIFAHFLINCQYTILQKAF